MGLAVFCGVMLAGAFLMVVLRWWSEGAIEASDALLLVIVFGGLIFGLFVARSVGQFMLAFVPLCTAGAYALYSYRLGSIRTYYKSRCKDYMLAIQADPRNRGAREYLADALYNLGELDRAVDELQAAVDMGAGMETQYKLNKWHKEQYVRDTPNPVCRWCETENQLNARNCVKCGADLPYDTALSRWLTGGSKAGMRYYLILIVGIAVIGVSVLLLPLKLALIPFLLCMAALVGWSLLKSARS